MELVHLIPVVILFSLSHHLFPEKGIDLLQMQVMCYKEHFKA
jgi:hypothetical protein